MGHCATKAPQTLTKKPIKDGANVGQVRSNFDVCVITTIHPPYEPRIYSRCTEAYLRAGLRVCLLSSWPKPVGPHPSLSCLTLRKSRGRRSKIVNSIRFFVSALGIRARVFHFHDLDFLPFGALLAILRPVRVIYDRHEDYGKDVLYNKEWIPRLLRRPLSTVTTLSERFCSRLIGNAIVTVPAWENQFNANRVRVTTIHNYTSWKAQRDLHHDIGIVYSGSMTFKYGLRELAEILRALKGRGYDIPVHVTMKNASAEARRFVDSLITEERLPLHIMPSVHPARIVELLQKGCIGLSFMQRSPEKLSSISAKLFEYMAFGLPVLGENYGYTAWIVKEARCGILADPQRPDTYVDAVQRMLNDPVFLEECRENGFFAIENRFNWDHEEGRLLTFFHAVRSGTKHVGKGVRK